MARFVRICLYCFTILWASLAHGAQPAIIFSDETQADSYDCALTISRGARASSKSATRLLLEWDVAKPHLQITIQSQVILIESVQGRKITRIGKIDRAIRGETQEHVVILRRGKWLGVSHNASLLFRGEVARGAGGQASYTPGAGWTVEEARVQQLEPVAFSDNFMRTADEPGAWVTSSGIWMLQSAWDNDPHRDGNAFNHTTYAQNPFAWVGRNPNGYALCTAGQPFWEDYTFTAAVRPQVGGAIGLAVNLADAQNGIIARWSPVTDQSPLGNTLLLYQMTDGVMTILAKARGGYIPGQWYKMTLISDLNGVRVLIDGSERLAVKNVTPWRGGVGLYAEGEKGAIFDDVTAYGRNLKTDLIAESRMMQINKRFIEDRNGMREWADSDWVAYPAVSFQWLHRWEFYGDHWVSLVVKPYVGINSQPGQIWLMLNNDGVASTSGYRAVLQSTADGKVLQCALWRDTTEVASKAIEALKPETDYTFRFWHIGNRLWLDMDGETILDYTDAKPLSDGKPAYRAEGILSRVRDVVAMGRSVENYMFADAPVDWLDEGTWMPTTRWACAPQWSFLGGWSRGDVVLWHKQRFRGDQIFQAYVGLKMEYPREREIYDHRFRNLGVTICGDGHNPRSGYTGIFGAPDEKGNQNKRTVLLRNGVEVASVAQSVPGRGQAHRTWFDLALQKDGRTITFWVEGQPALTYEDPNPLDDGVPALWSTDNGLALARARIHYAHPPTPRTDPSVAIDEPWYPEWANVGRPIILDFPTACATSGTSVQLEVTARKIPSEQKTPPVIGAKTLSVTPDAPGDFWYEISATDGRYRSPAYHLALPAFIPTLGRDDSRALLLYRFDEGQGYTVRDHSAVAPGIDLTIPRGSGTHWVPGQGLWVNGATSLMSARGAEKLMAIAQGRAATLEFWISTDTVYPLTGWSGCLLSWELGADKRNLAIGQNSYTFLVAAQGSGVDGQNANVIKSGGFRTSLQHYVVTWDGGVTRIYCNGKRIAESSQPWATERWTPDAPVILGNQADGTRAYVGSYYLVAVHNACFSEAQVKRHYEAGPSAR